MIRAASVGGIAFGTVDDGDGRSDAAARRSIAAELGIPTEWATVSQVHGSSVVIATDPGPHGEADGLVTSMRSLPLAIATADCVPIAISGRRSVSLVHAGWRGIAAGIVVEALATMRTLDDEPTHVVIGPHIGPCCYEVGDEVVTAIGGYRATTRAGTQSVDLASAVSGQIGDIPVERMDSCTMDDDRFASFRRNGTPVRQVAVAWRT